MVRKRGEPHQRPFVLECRYPIAYALSSLRRHSRPNRRANLGQGAASRFRYASKIFVDAFRSATAFRGRIARARFHSFHTGMLQEAQIQIQMKPASPGDFQFRASAEYIPLLCPLDRAAASGRYAIPEQRFIHPPIMMNGLANSFVLARSVNEFQQRQSVRCVPAACPPLFWRESQHDLPPLHPALSRLRLIS